MFGLPHDASTGGFEIDNLIYYIHILMLALFIGWGAFYLYILVRFRQSRNPKADYDGVKTHASSYLELTVAVIEAVLLIGFSIPIYARVAAKIPSEDESVLVRVIAQQFNWNFQYAGVDGKLGKISPDKIDYNTGNTLGLDKSDPAALDDVIIESPCLEDTGECPLPMYIPAEQPVIVRLTSKDVIHSFGIPNLRVKQDAIPGMEIPVWFVAKETGKFSIACSQLCGDLHYSMKGLVNVVSKDEFTKWLGEQTPAATLF